MIRSDISSVAGGANLHCPAITNTFSLFISDPEKNAQFSFAEDCMSLLADT